VQFVAGFSAMMMVYFPSELNDTLYANIM
jgi:hypothetical protein